ncbi:YIP1 family protein [Rivularia sp. UHCC 0363]|uniref:YIP1 family protein n=1 Tax=Rivularia sp. UHCC 0363 TaxID=3110244 RepID=UPI002B1F6790|nr:YIP1 family protein [Rivularia sp. UHCC 0363]MEA5596952.1 YIP1 family protein [Rivularia sp. UHCC 0363]
MNATQNNSQWQFLYTLKNALLLNAELYDNACNTPLNNQLALTTVILAGVSHALGNIFILLINRAAIYLLLLALLIDVVSIIIGYYVWTLTIWKVGQWIKSKDPKFNNLLSPIGFAYAPQVLNFLTLIPLLGRPIELVLALWSLLAVIVAVTQALDITTRKAGFICLIAWPLIQVAVGFIQVLEQKVVQFTS